MLGEDKDILQVAGVAEDELEYRFLGMSEDRLVLGLMELLFLSGTILEAVFL